MSDAIYACAKCRLLKPLSEFYTLKRRSHNCRACHQAYSRADYRRLPAQVEAVRRNGRKIMFQSRFLPEVNARLLIKNAKSRALKRGLPFSITVTDILPMPAVCPVLGILLRRGIGCTIDESPTIDRIVPERGYVPGNVIVISQKANRIKTNATPDEVMKVALFLVWAGDGV